MNRQPPHAHSRKVSARRERRERNRKKPDLAGGLRTLLTIALMAECLRVAFCSPRLKLAEVQVDGTKRYSSQDLQRAGGIRLGQNIFRVNLVKVSDNLRKDPVIREAVVTRELPRTIRIDVTERAPALQVVVPGGSYHVDRDGVLFERATALNRGLPLLRIPPKDLPSLGGSLRPELMRSFWECDRLAKQEHLKLLNVSVDEGGELWLNTLTISPVDSPSGQTGQSTPPSLAIRLGRGTDLPEKFRDIRRTLSSVHDLTTKASYLDVMCAGRPAYMSASDGAAPQP